MREGAVYSYGEGLQFKATKSHFVYLVSVAFTMKPIKVLPKDIEVMEIPRDASHIIPFSGSSFQWTNKLKREWSEEMKKASRDEKGKWV
jgi:hypothetical protein